MLAGFVFLQILGFVWGERVRAVAKAFAVLALTAPISGCGIFQCFGTAIYGVAVNICS
ncbi:hypothetical protein AWB74_03427 [Caballeronia arvi]|uniref:Uncharacterized protein n=1 Tax=Caballeronia arvi TaxID=1777135 RepID=A0A158J544_9BURK|nr:hypothetical protein AWB74_03427 [Caballeronia arvi]